MPDSVLSTFSILNLIITTGGVTQVRVATPDYPLKTQGPREVRVTCPRSQLWIWGTKIQTLVAWLNVPVIIITLPPFSKSPALSLLVSCSSNSQLKEFTFLLWMCDLKVMIKEWIKFTLLIFTTRAVTPFREQLRSEDTLDLCDEALRPAHQEQPE